MTETKDAKDGYVKSETHNHITTIEFYHPHGNSLPSKLLTALTQQIKNAGNNKDIHAILLRSFGQGAFCGGASFDELKTIKTEQEGIHFFNGFANLINAMRKCPQFIIARVHGKCVGGGVGIVAAADYAIALDGAEIRLSELSLGIGPFVVGPAVQRKLGLSAFTQLAIDSTMWRNGDWARRKGLYAELHPTLESMEESIRRLTTALSHTNPEAITELKRTFWAGTDDWDQLLSQRAAISSRLVTSEYSSLAIGKFKQKVQE